MRRPFADSKQIWAAHCEQHYVPLYFRSWWMDCVCGTENWDVCLSLDDTGKVEGALVFYLKKRLGLPVITMPPLTAYSGLWLHPPLNLTKSSSRMAFEKRVCEKAIKQLPHHIFFYQQWHPDITNWLPYFWKGFRQTTLYTYRLALAENALELTKNMNKSARKRSRKAAGEFYIKYAETPDIVFDLYKKSLLKQGKAPYFSMETLTRLDMELINKNQRKIITAAEASGNIIAAQYLAWDEQTTYALFGGIHPGFRNTGAWYFLLSEAISNNFVNSKIFDFEGSIIESVEESLRSFGGKLIPHFKITKASNKWLEALHLLRSR
jgi:hypothetical protein